MEILDEEQTVDGFDKCKKILKKRMVNHGVSVLSLLLGLVVGGFMVFMTIGDFLVLGLAIILNLLLLAYLFSFIKRFLVSRNDLKAEKVIVFKTELKTKTKTKRGKRWYSAIIIDDSTTYPKEHIIDDKTYEGLMEGNELLLYLGSHSKQFLKVEKV
ncbi:MAG: hypothetical protein GY810_05400 [Aureispira sp.]|nr:hypothetical protein [Aureispira sp.]